MSIHPSSDVKSYRIGKNTQIWQYCVVLSNAIIGEDCNINANVFIENDVIIGDRVTIKSGVQVWDGITIENDVFIGPNVTFTNDLYPRSKQYPEKFISIDVKQGASIGANSTILPNVKIGEFSMIGAGSVVTKDVLPFELVYGNPAKHKGWVGNLGNKLVRIDENNFIDELTGELFELTMEGLLKK